MKKKKSFISLVIGQWRLYNITKSRIWEFYAVSVMNDIMNFWFSYTRVLKYLILDR